MNPFIVTVFLLSFGAVTAQDAPAPAPGALHEPATTACELRCKNDTGIDADTCMTECQTYTDTQTHHLDEGLDGFVADESYNENDGEGMREIHNEQAPEEVPECAPEPGYEATSKPEWDTLDTNGDGFIDADEAFTFCEKACIPDEMGQQIFSEADLNQDKKISKEEFESAGEETNNEEAMDGVLEGTFEGDDEYNSVQNPPLEEFDEDDSGGLDNDEVNNMYEHQIEQRTEHEPGAEETVEELQPEIQDAIDEVDTNDDGVISGDEYTAEGDENNLGDELQEAAEADEDVEEPDDLARAGTTPPPAAAAALISHRRLRHGHRMGRMMKSVKPVRVTHKRPHRKMKFAEALLAKARLQQRLRHAALLQRQHRLRHAMQSRKKAHAHHKSRAFRHHM
eukprot:gnl/MRDRNA2_/MRDRNA2_87772_c0_seq1.p1 gnl/MRDRNA2_/MRDRNA2_87772_c0~~gnl/MRDRNA2_/MRDRNA2_87772_c0_seq1.p1  ORF type:complete len:418 (-),score=114.71 gnl/MRDRNA2_/MRDRNA2_87772_c0_seq1:111-1298(-)